jgi:hypothetical protein
MKKTIKILTLLFLFGSFLLALLTFLLQFS